MDILCLQSTFSRRTQKNNGKINSHYFSVQSLLPQRLLVRKTAFFCLTEFFKLRVTVDNMNSHVGCGIQFAVIFRVCCRIPWKNQLRTYNFWGYRRSLSTAHLETMSSIVCFRIRDVQVILLALTRLLIRRVTTKKHRWLYVVTPIVFLYLLINLECDV